MPFAFLPAPSNTLILNNKQLFTVMYRPYLIWAALSAPLCPSTPLFRHPPAATVALCTGLQQTKLTAALAALSPPGQPILTVGVWEAAPCPLSKGAPFLPSLVSQPIAPGLHAHHTITTSILFVFLLFIYFPTLLSLLLNDNTHPLCLLYPPSLSPFWP